MSQPDLILVAEDSPTQAEQLKYILERHGYQAIVAENGVQALTRLAATRPALLISDIVMPEMDGYELCRRIRADESLADLPVVLLTALVNTKDVLEGLSCGADSFITKPYNRDYLLAQVAQMLSRGRGQSGPDQIGRVEIELAGTKHVIAADQTRTLTLLISTYEAAVWRNLELSRTQEELQSLNDRLEDLVVEKTAALSEEISVRRQTEVAMAKANEDLREALEKIRVLNDLLPICAKCKKIRDDKGEWNQIEQYISERTNTSFTHGICPTCSKELYGEKTRRS